MSPNTPAKPAEKPATKSQAEIDREAADAATKASGKPAEKPADHIPGPGEPGYTPPETVPDEVANALDAKTGATTSTNDAEHGDKPTGDDPEPEEDDSDYRGAAVRTTRLTDLLKAKKDEFVIYGYGGVAITLGDLRGLLSKYKG